MAEPAKSPKRRAVAKPREKRIKKKPANGEASAKLDAIGVDAICHMFAEGETFRAISAQVGVSRAAIADWIAASSDRSARVREARKMAAEAEDDKGLEELTSLPADPTTGAVARAREIAQHRRWRAKMLDPDRYGDRATIDLNATIESADTAALLSELAQALSITPEQARKMVGFAEGEKEAS